MLKITLKPNERVVVNGCVLRNGPRRQSLVIENRADIVREGDLLKPDAQATPVSKVYFLLQTALIRQVTGPETEPPRTWRRRMVWAGIGALAGGGAVAMAVLAWLTI